MTFLDLAQADGALFVTQLADRFVIPDNSGNNRTGTSYTFGLVPDAAWMDVGTAFTILAWVKTTNTGFNMIACREGGTGRVFQFRTNSGALDFVKIAGGVLTVTVAATINNGAYHLVAATYDGANIRLYKDSSTPLITSGAATGNLDGTQGISIGYRPNTTLTAVADVFFGELPGIAYFGSVLTGARIAAYFAEGPPTGAAPPTSWDGSGAWGVAS